VVRIRKAIDHKILVIAPYCVVTGSHVAMVTEHLNQPIVATDGSPRVWERNLIGKLSL